eukprot:1158554-Pelagomonas_calceolata.AAC.12
MNKEQGLMDVRMQARFWHKLFTQMNMSMSSMLVGKVYLLIGAGVHPVQRAATQQVSVVCMKRGVTQLFLSTGCPSPHLSLFPCAEASAAIQTKIFSY